MRARPVRRRWCLTPAAERKLLEHDWPGNARELTNIVQRAAWLASGGRIDACRPRHGRESAARSPRAPPPPQEAGLGHDLKERERELILATLGAHRRQPQTGRRAPRDQPADAAPQAAAAQGGRRRGPAPARSAARRRPDAMSSMQIQQVLAEMRALQARASGTPPRSRPSSTQPADFAELLEGFGRPHRHHAEPGDRARGAPTRRATRASTSPR